MIKFKYDDLSIGNVCVHKQLKILITRNQLISSYQDYVPIILATYAKARYFESLHACATPLTLFNLSALSLIKSKFTDISEEVPEEVELLYDNLQMLANKIKKQIKIFPLAHYCINETSRESEMTKKPKPF